MMNSIELVFANFEINNNTASIILDTSNIDYLGKSFVVFDLNNEINEINEFIIMMLKLYCNETNIKNLQKMLSGTTIYLPLKIFFSCSQKSIYQNKHHKYK